MITAEEFKAGLPKRNGGTGWTIDTFSTYVALLYPHVTVVPGQEWSRAQSKYQFLCNKHGVYEAWGFDILNLNKGCRCRGCTKEINVNSAGSRRQSRSTPEDKHRAAK